MKDKTGDEIEKRLPGGKVKKKAKAEVVLETSTRSKKKCVTTIQGLSCSANTLIIFLSALSIKVNHRNSVRNEVLICRSVLYDVEYTVLSELL